MELLSHRVVWSLLFVLLLLPLLGRTRRAVAVVRDRRRTGRLAAAAALIAVNWGVYIHGVNSGHVVETSLGYFTTPLVSVLLGVVVLRERLRPAQRVAVGTAAVAVLVLTLDAGRPPWIALALAGTFGAYGLIKKTVGVGAVEGLAVETALLAPLAAAYLVVHDGGTLTGEGPLHTSLLVGAGVVTAVPLLLFATAAARIPLVSLGVLQYLAPCLQLLAGVTVRGESLGGVQLAGFALVWLALVVFTTDLVRSHRRDVTVPEPV